MFTYRYRCTFGKGAYIFGVFQEVYQQQDKYTVLIFTAFLQFMGEILQNQVATHSNRYRGVSNLAVAYDIVHFSHYDESFDIVHFLKRNYFSIAIEG